MSTPVLKVTDLTVEFWVDGVWYPAALNSRQKSTIPVLSETETNARLMTGSDICRKLFNEGFSHNFRA